MDGKVVGDDRLDVDESLLTGESDAVTKKPGDEIFAGSFCVSGGGYYEAEKSGNDSLAGSIASQARTFTVVLTPLQRGINLITRVLLIIVTFFLIAGAAQFAGFTISRGPTCSSRRRSSSASSRPGSS